MLISAILVTRCACATLDSFCFLFIVWHHELGAVYVRWERSDVTNSVRCMCGEQGHTKRHELGTVYVRWARSYESHELGTVYVRWERSDVTNSVRCMCGEKGQTLRTRYGVCAVSKVIRNNRAVRHIHVKRTPVPIEWEAGWAHSRPGSCGNEIC
jgi:hypothetical protein